ncbi:hypothetical protein P5673_031888 [Acropora cervicornis]|uniref:Protein ANTAGONIST OF LIKE HETEROCHROMATIN PROTEIN 1-like n=1 Tax=Acropora cervicornis TaxID=6130 RepID=A0AAD9PSQ9_ACRCE|nr:hypothetical protein P5673_031888 [Acropora cervicornis]
MLEIGSLSKDDVNDSENVFWKASRFEIVDEEYIEESKDKSEDENTNSTEYRKNGFKKWANVRNFQVNAEEYESDALSQTLSQFQIAEIAIVAVNFSRWRADAFYGFCFTRRAEKRAEDTPAFKEIMRMSPDQFKEILNATEPDICKQSTKMGGEPIVPVERRALTLRFLATGKSFRSLHFQFRISRPAISYIVTEVLVCEAIPKKLGPSYLKVPSSEQEWIQIAKQFKEKWNFPNCPGTIDGKHITLQPPPN